MATIFKPLVSRLYFGKSKTVNGKQTITNRFWPVLAYTVPEPKIGETIVAMSSVHFSCDPFPKNSAFCTTQIRYQVETLASPFLLPAESAKLLGQKVSCCPGLNLKPRKFQEAGAGQPLELDPIGVYETISRFGDFQVNATMVKPNTRLLVVVWAWCRSSGALETDYLSVAGGDDSPESEDYSQLTVIRS